MKSILICSVLLGAVAGYYGCAGGSKKSPQEAAGVTAQQMADVERNTQPFDPRQLVDPGSAPGAPSFLALRLYLLDGKLVADSARAQVVPGQFNRGIPRGDFRIAYLDAAGKELGATYIENIFYLRVCDDKGQQIGLTAVPRGWTEIFIPNDPNIASLAFYQNNEAVQRLDLAPVYQRLPRDPNRKD